MNCLPAFAVPRSFVSFGSRLRFIDSSLFGYLCLMDMFQILPAKGDSETKSSYIPFGINREYQNLFEHLSLFLLSHRTCHPLPKNPFESPPRDWKIQNAERAHRLEETCLCCWGTDWYFDLKNPEWVWCRPQYDERHDWFLYELLNCLLENVPSFGIWPLHLKLQGRQIASSEAYEDWKKELKTSEGRILIKHYKWLDVPMQLRIPFSSSSSSLSNPTSSLFSIENKNQNRNQDNNNTNAWIEKQIVIPIRTPQERKSYVSPFRKSLFHHQLKGILKELRRSGKRVNSGGLRYDQVSLYQKKHQDQEDGIKTKITKKT